MKIIVIGSLGNISKPLTQDLVAKGHDVTVISTDTEKQTVIESIGAHAAIGRVEDLDFLVNTFSGADAVYSMVPPPNFMDPELDLKNDYKKIAHNYVQALEKSGVNRLVHLSSIGAHTNQNNGLIQSHYDAEAELSQLSEVNISFIRPTAFYYNLYNFIGGIKSMGMIASNYGADDWVSWVSPIDIASAVSEEIEKPLTGKKVIYVASEELTCNEVASILGESIGIPDLKWIRISNEQMLEGMKSFGVPLTLASGFVEMNAAMHSGELFTDYHKHKPEVLGKVKLKDFAKNFAEAYHKAL